MKPEMNTHHWVFRLEVENDFRNARSGITNQWYGPLAIFFDAFTVSGVAPRYVEPYHRIRIFLNDNLVGEHKNREEAFGQIKRLLGNSPQSCRADCLAHMGYFYQAVYGKEMKDDPTLL